MRKKIISYMLCAGILFSGIDGWNLPQVSAAEQAINLMDWEQAALLSAQSGKTAAFPGAQGGGMYTTGARGAWDNGQKIEVYHVTNCNDSGEGSFRDAVSKGNRIVVFDVSGNIDLESELKINAGNLTILGQTAPGDGICFRRFGVKIVGSNVILRYLRFRAGEKHTEDGRLLPQDTDSLAIATGARDVIVDHCSISWCSDENLSGYGLENTTLQWNIISEGLNKATHVEGGELQAHGYGGIWGGKNFSAHHNLLASNGSRNPRIGSTQTLESIGNYYQDTEAVIDLRNNVIYNWGDKAGYGAENGTGVNIVNNYYKPGPALRDGDYKKRSRIFELSPGTKYTQNLWGASVYAHGNYVDVPEEDPGRPLADLVNEDNWQIDNKTGVYLDKAMNKDTDLYGKLDAPIDTYLYDYPVITQTAQEAYESVLEDAGAQLPRQDLVDQRIIENTREGTAPNGSGVNMQFVEDYNLNIDGLDTSGTIGGIDHPEDGIPEGQEHLYDAYGYPLFDWDSETDPLPRDTDGDGIPDTWEEKMALDPTNPHDGLEQAIDGYTWLEVYANSLSASEKEEHPLSVELEPLSGGVLGGNEPVALTAQITGTAVKVEFYCDGTLAAEGALEDNGDGTQTATAQLSGLKAGVHTILAKAYKEQGQTVISAVRYVTVMEGDPVTDWTVEGQAAVSGEVYSLADGARLTKPVTGDFTLVTRVKSISSLAREIKTGLFVAGGGEASLIGVLYDSNAEKKIVFGPENDLQTGTLDADAYPYLKITRAGTSLIFAAGKSLGEWTELGQIQSSAAQTAGAFVEEHNSGETVSQLSLLQLVTQTSQPEIRITNVEPYQRLGFSESIRVEAVPQSPEYGIQELHLYYDDNTGTRELGAHVFDAPQTGRTEQEFQVSFPAVSTGTLRAVVYDENLGVGTQNLPVSISADPAPWKLRDIGGGEEVKTYVSATDDYTYKLYSPDGQLSGTGDNFGYLYQQFTGNSRICYRSRLNSGQLFGLVLRDSLDPDAVTYAVVAENDGSGLKYKLKTRTQQGGAMTEQEIPGLSGDTKYLMAEVEGSTLRVYNTVKDTTIYQTKSPEEPVVEVDITPLLKAVYENGAVKLDNSTGTYDGGTVFAAGYDPYGRLTAVKTASVPPQGSEVSLGQVDASLVKAFVWDSAQTMTPVSGAPSYYLGFGAGYTEGTGFAPDLGWIMVDSMENDQEGGYWWDLEHGLDWGWYVQDKGLLAPQWTSAPVEGNNGGKLMLSTDENYTAERTVYRQFSLPTDATVEYGFDLYINGEGGLDFYMQLGDNGKAYPITFGQDGAISAGGKASGASYEKNEWYQVSAMVDQMAPEAGASVAVRRMDGTTVASVSGAPAVAFTPGFSPAYTEKNLAQAVYFEPDKGKAGRYYIDNVRVFESGSKRSLETVINSAAAYQEADYTSESWSALREALENAQAVYDKPAPTAKELGRAARALRAAIGNLVPKAQRVNKGTTLWTFENETVGDIPDGKALNGLTFTNGAATGKMIFEARNKTIDGKRFTNVARFNVDGTTALACVSFEVDDEADLVIYGEPNGTGDRYFVISDGGTETRLTVDPQTPNVYRYTHTGGKGKVYLYAKGGMRAYGIEKTDYEIILSD